MEEKDGLSRRRKSIMIIDKKGKAHEVLKQVKKKDNGESVIKEKKGDKSINSSEAEGKMGRKDKKCKCEMCGTDNRGKCAKCKEEKCCKCDSDASVSIKNSSMSFSNGSIGVINASKNSSVNNMNSSMNASKDIMNSRSASVNSMNSSMNASKDTMDSRSASVNNGSVNNSHMNSVNSMNVNTSTNSVEVVTKQTTTQSDIPNQSSNKPQETKKLGATIENQSKDKSNDVRADDHKTNLKTVAGVATAGAVVGAGPGIILGKSAQEEKKIKEAEPQTTGKKTVTIDEDKNEEYSVSKDSEKSLPLSEEEKFDGKTSHVNEENLQGMDNGFAPPLIPTDKLPEDSEIKRERENNNVVCEGHIWKRRRIFACFWHEKYFVLTKEGILKYHKANGTKYSKGNWNIKNVNRIHEVFIGTEGHPYRLALVCDTENLLFGFDDPDTREFWYNHLSRFIDF